MRENKGGQRAFAVASLSMMALTVGCSSDTTETTTTEVPDVVELVREITVCTETVGGDCLEKEALAFGDIPVGETRRLAVRLSNTGSQSERIDSVTLTPKALEWRVVNGGVPGNLPHSLGPGETLRIEVVAPAGLAPGPMEKSTVTIRYELNSTELNMNVTGHVSDCVGDNVNCDSDWANGCEANLNTSKSHCGECNQPCSVSKGKTSCSEGKCTVTSCNDGYFGEECLACPGDESPCSGNGTCNDGVDGDGSCACNDGLAGDDCSATADPCADDPCAPMATCSSVRDSFECACMAGFTGSGLACEPCDDSCSECDGTEPSDCTACADGLELDDPELDKGACVEATPSE